MLRRANGPWSGTRASGAGDGDLNNRTEPWHNLPMTDSGPAAATQVWAWQNSWSRAADAAKRRIGRSRTGTLLLAVTAATLGALATGTMAHVVAVGRTAAFVAAVAAAFTPVAAIGSSTDAIAAWIRMRSVGESLKSELYLHLAGLGPYRAAATGPLLLERVDVVLSAASDLAHAVTPIPATPLPLPAVADIESYIDVRVTGQLHSYYRPRAAFLRRRVTLIRRAELALAACAAVLSAAAGILGAELIATWIAAVTTVATAVTAHAAAARYSYQELEFARTAAALERLLARRAIAAAHDPSSNDEFADRCEEVIAVQNEAWMAKWSAP